MKLVMVLICFSDFATTISWKESLSQDLDSLSELFHDTVKQERSALERKERSDQTIFMREKRSDQTISSQTVYQFQKKQRKCKNLKSYGIASGSNALRCVFCNVFFVSVNLVSLLYIDIVFSYMSFVASVITLVLNINNNINANNNNNNQVIGKSC